MLPFNSTLLLPLWEEGSGEESFFNVVSHLIEDVRYRGEFWNLVPHKYKVEPCQEATFHNPKFQKAKVQTEQYHSLQQIYQMIQTGVRLVVFLL